MVLGSNAKQTQILNILKQKIIINLKGSLKKCITEDYAGHNPP